MRQSNGYIIFFTAVMTIIVGGLLSLASQGLAPQQKKSIELDTKTQILNAVMVLDKKDDILSIYDKRIKSLVVNYNGDEVTQNEKGEPLVAEQVDIAKNYKEKPENRLYPVFKYMNESNPEQIDAYILPVYGAGLWDKIWGYIALDNEIATIEGVSFGHKSETPGLGARIATKEIQERYKDKKIYDNSGNLVSVMMVKGENNPGIDDYHVDGMSGATLTGKGVNNMLKEYLNSYEAYFKKINSNSGQ